MEWVENIRVREKEEWSSSVDKLEPVLTRGIASTKDSQRSADLLAHVVWCYFLRTRDGIFGMDPAGAYARAVEKDPNNPYAEAMWGHWILWNGGKLGEASRHFSAGLVSDRHRDFVRNMQFAAISECQEDECDEEMMRLPKTILQEEGSGEAEIPDEVSFFFFRTGLVSEPVSNPFLHVLAPAEQIATFHWLFDSIDFADSKSLLRTCYLAFLQHVTAKLQAALSTYPTNH